MISSCGVLTVLPLRFNTAIAENYPEEVATPLVAWAPLSSTSGTLTFRVPTEAENQPGNVHVALTPFSGENGELNIINVQSRTIGGGGDNIVFTLVFSATTPVFEVIAVTSTEPCCQPEDCGR